MNYSFHSVSREAKPAFSSRYMQLSGYFNNKVNSMKSTILAAAILYSLAGPAAVFAEAPAVTVKPFAVKVVPADIEPAAQQAVAEKLPEAAAPVSELTEQQAVAEILSDTAVTAAGVVEPQVDSEIPAEVAVPLAGITEEQAAPEAPLEEAVAGGTSVSDTIAPRKPCPMQGMGKMGKGMGQGGKGPGCRKPGCRKQGCDRDGSGQQNKHEQVVRRLDMIEARIAKMEAMLESLMQR
jgi:hypothetical protein